MAAIDKTYVKSYKDYKEIRDWANKTDVIYPNGINGGKMSNWLYYPDLTEEDFNGEELPLWNTTMEVDMFLYKNCPFKLVQDRLKEVYYDYISCLSRQPINKHEVGNHFILPKKILKNYYYHISIEREGEQWRFSSDYNEWIEANEFGPWNTLYCCRLITSRKELARQIRKWNLPKGVTIIIDNGYNNYKIRIKK